MILNELIKEIDKRKMQLDAYGELSDDVKKLLWDKIRLEWNYHSNAIEGNQLTLGETKSLLLLGLTAKGKPLKDVLDMKGHEKGLQYLYSVANKEINITEKVIEKFHSIIMSDPFEDNQDVVPGKYKSVPNEIIINEIGEKVEFTLPEDVIPEMNKLINWLSNVMNPPKRSRRKYTLHPLLIATTFHLEFVLIHPFADGNGRMSRILMNLILMQCGFPPVVIKVEDRENYINSLNRARHEGVEVFAEFIGECLLRSLDMYNNAAEGKPIDEPNDVEKRIAVLTTRLSKVKPGKIRHSAEEAIKTIAEIAIPFFTTAAIEAEKLDPFFVDKQMTFHWSRFRKGESEIPVSLKYNVLVPPRQQILDNSAKNILSSVITMIEEVIDDDQLLKVILKDEVVIQEIDGVSIHFYWTRFVGHDMPDLALRANLSCSLTPDGYVIRLDNKMLCSNNYGDMLTEDEQNNSITALINTQLVAIEEHIAKSTKGSEKNN